MDNADHFIEKCEQDATNGKTPAEQHEALERTHTSSTISSSSSDGSTASVERREIGMSRVPTARDNMADLERNQTAMSRIQTARSQHSGTVGASIKSRKSNKPLPNFGAGKPYPPPLPDREEYVVEFDGPDDPMHAQNWPLKKKLATAVMLGYTTLVAAFGSSIFSSATRVVAQKFEVSTEVGILGVSLYVLGFATGPILWAPGSELYGRRKPLIISSFGFSIFFIACATAKDLQTVLLGFGLMAIFLQSLNYLVDAYLMFAASAIAANTFLRSLCGAGFPLFATYMFEGMGVQWAGTLLGCVAAVLVPVPILFYLKGAKIRERSQCA
ncbi:putative major facilitator superfamily transporter protein [Lasiodiplodia theobromae]|nr:putative major facilitator superfamily transporter protein [Lasiodiplodia theobromae]